MLQSILAINHGALGQSSLSLFTLHASSERILGVVSWSDPTSDDIKAVSSKFALALPQITPYILSSDSKRTYRNVVTNRVDVGIWSGIEDLGETTVLMLATNMNYEELVISWEELGLDVSDTSKVRLVYEGNARLSDDGSGIVLGEVGSTAVIIG